MRKALPSSSGILLLVAADGEHGSERLDRQLGLREVGDVELDDVLRVRLSHACVRRKLVVAHRLHGGHGLLLFSVALRSPARDHGLRGRSERGAENY